MFVSLQWIPALGQKVMDSVEEDGVFCVAGYGIGSLVGMKGLDKIGKMAKIAVQGGKVASILEKANCVDDLLKLGITSADDLAKAGITSVDDLLKVGVNSMDDLSKLGINSVDDLAKLGITSEDDLARLGIKSGDEIGNGHYTGIGTSGKGIPINELPDGVLKDIYPNDEAVYGYSPKKGTRYDTEKYNFENKEFCDKNRAIREDYLKGSDVLQKEINTMKSAGKSSKEIAEHCVETRNQQKVTARSNMDPSELETLEKGNVERYGNPIGPTSEDLFNKIKNKLIKQGAYESDAQVWDAIIESSMRKDDVINTLLGLKH